MNPLSLDYFDPPDRLHAPALYALRWEFGDATLSKYADALDEYPQTEDQGQGQAACHYGLCFWARVSGVRESHDVWESMLGMGLVQNFAGPMGWTPKRAAGAQVLSAYLRLALGWINPAEPRPTDLARVRGVLAQAAIAEAAWAAERRVLTLRELSPHLTDTALADYAARLLRYSDVPAHAEDMDFGLCRWGRNYEVWPHLCTAGLVPSTCGPRGKTRLRTDMAAYLGELIRQAGVK